MERVVNGDIVIFVQSSDKGSGRIWFLSWFCEKIPKEYRSDKTSQDHQVSVCLTSM